MTNLPERLQAAKIKVIYRNSTNGQPYLATPLFALKFIETTECITNGQPTFGVDKHWRLYYHPDTFKDSQFSDSELQGAIVHELNHLLREHHRRGELISDVHQEILNIAQDLAINTHFKDQKLDLPKWAAFPAKFGYPEGLLSEEYYDLLLKDPNIKKIKISVTSGQCGSCANGKKQPWELPANDSNNPALSELEKSLITRKTAEDILDHQRNKGRGSVPADLLRWAEELLVPKINWRNELRAKITNAINYEKGITDYSYTVTSRRQGIYDSFVMPGLRKPSISICVIVDSSGSMSKTMIAQCLTETKQILKDAGIKDGIRFITCDAEVQTNQQLRNIKHAKVRGGGGTDMRVAIEQAILLKPIPQIIIVLTDGYTPWPNEKPSKINKFIVGLVESGSEVAPQWAKTIHISL